METLEKSSPSATVTTPRQSPLVASSPPPSSSVPIRRSVRIASKLNNTVADGEGDGTGLNVDQESDKSKKGNKGGSGKGKPRVLTGVMDLNLESGSDSGKERLGFDELGSRRRSHRVATADCRNLVVDLNCVPSSFDMEDGGDKGKANECETDTVNGGNQQNLNSSGLDLTSASGGLRRRSQRLAKATQLKSVVDMNIQPLKLDDESDNGLLDSSPGARTGKRKTEARHDASKNAVDDTSDEGILDSSPRVRVTKRRVEESGVNSTAEKVIDLDNLEEEPNPVATEGNTVIGTRRYNAREKGKGLLVKETWLSIGMDPVDLDLNSEEENVIENAVSVLSSKEASGSVQLPETGTLEGERTDPAQRQRVSPSASAREVAAREVRYRARLRRQARGRFLNIARERASEFAHFNHREEEDNVPAPVPESEEPLPEADDGVEDWPGPFSTAMKIIRDRANNLNAPPKKSIGDISKDAPVITWTPSEDKREKSVSVPSLQDLCFDILAKHADAIVSLENVPDALRNKLSQLLCKLRKMDHHFMNLLASGTPTDVRVTDCSSITEEQITGILGSCDMKKLKVLQLDLCCRCMPDYILRATLARSPNSLPALAAISLRGACRVTDSGLNALIASAPALRSINLGQCSLITDSSINTIADSLGSVVRELYLDDCQNLDAMLILPALKKLEHLEVLSVADIQTVCNKFVHEFVAERGANMKELILANCGKLTDTSVKTISEGCSGLLALDLVNLHKLTDSSVGYLANGCQSIQMLKLCRNAFSDEAIAAFLEASGESLTELSLNNVKKVGLNTAISISRRCSRKLLHLDLSWCRKLPNEALGLIVDSCSSLKVLKLFGCTQITKTFVDGHSNPSVKIIGLKLSPLLEPHDTFNSQRALMRYSS